MAKNKKTPDVGAAEREFAEQHFEAEQPAFGPAQEIKSTPVASGYVFLLQGKHSKANGQILNYLPGDPVEGLSANEIMHFLSNGIIEPRKG